MVCNEDTLTDTQSQLKRLTMLVDGLVNDVESLKVDVLEKINALSELSSASTNAKVDTDEHVGPPTEELPCCRNTTPCKHWAYNDIEYEWMNTISGRIKDA